MERPVTGARTSVGARLRGAVAAAHEPLRTRSRLLFALTRKRSCKTVERVAEAPDQIEIAFALKATGELGNLGMGRPRSHHQFQRHTDLDWPQPPSKLPHEPGLGFRLLSWAGAVTKSCPGAGLQKTDSGTPICRR